MRIVPGSRCVRASALHQPCVDSVYVQAIGLGVEYQAYSRVVGLKREANKFNQGVRSCASDAAMRETPLCGLFIYSFLPASFICERARKISLVL